MKTALLAVILGITGGIASLLAVPAPALKIHPAKWAPDYGEPVVPQVEDEEETVGVPKPLEHYSVAQAKTEKPARHMHVVRRRPNFFEKLLASFINFQKHPPAKSSRKQSRTSSRRG